LGGSKKGELKTGGETYTGIVSGWVYQNISGQPDLKKKRGILGIGEID